MRRKRFGKLRSTAWSLSRHPSRWEFFGKRAIATAQTTPTPDDSFCGLKKPYNRLSSSSPVCGQSPERVKRVSKISGRAPQEFVYEQQRQKGFTRRNLFRLVPFRARRQGVQAN